MNANELRHYGVLGMHWGVRKFQPNLGGVAAVARKAGHAINTPGRVYRKGFKKVNSTLTAPGRAFGKRVANNPYSKGFAKANRVLTAPSRAYTSIFNNAAKRVGGAILSTDMKLVKAEGSYLKKYGSTVARIAKKIASVDSRIPSATVAGVKKYSSGYNKVNKVLTTPGRAMGKRVANNPYSKGFKKVNSTLTSPARTVNRKVTSVTRNVSPAVVAYRRHKRLA